MTFMCMFCLEQGFLVTSLVCPSRMEQDNKQGVCEAPDSEDKGMGSDFENSEDRGGDHEDSSDAQDAGKRGGHPEEDMGSNPQEGASEERELVSDFCTGEDKAAVSVEVAPLTFRSGGPRVPHERGPRPCEGLL